MTGKKKQKVEITVGITNSKTLSEIVMFKAIGPISFNRRDLIEALEVSQDEVKSP